MPSPVPVAKSVLPRRPRAWASRSPGRARIRARSRPFAAVARDRVRDVREPDQRRSDRDRAERRGRGRRAQADQRGGPVVVERVADRPGERHASGDTLLRPAAGHPREAHGRQREEVPGPRRCRAVRGGDAEPGARGAVGVREQADLDVARRTGAREGRSVPRGPLPCDTAVASTGVVVSTPANWNSEILDDAAAEFTIRNKRPGTCSGLLTDVDSVRVAGPVTARSRVSARSPYVNDAVETPAGCETPTIQVWFGFGLLGGSHEVDSPAGNRRYWVRPSSSTSARAGAAVHSMTAAPKAAASDRTLTARRYPGLMGASTDSRLGDSLMCAAAAIADHGVHELDEPPRPRDVRGAVAGARGGAGRNRVLRRRHPGLPAPTPACVTRQGSARTTPAS